MRKSAKVKIERLPTGVPRLDDVLGGGIPEYSFNVIPGEPALKMMRYQQQFTFFDKEQVNKGIHFINLSQQAMEADLAKVLESIVDHVQKLNPAIVVVDSFRTLVRATVEIQPGTMQLPEFVQRLAMHLTSWQVTSFLIGEYEEPEMRQNPVFTMADGIVVLSQNVERNSMVRKLRVPKVRGQAPQPGLHTVRIDQSGLQIFPRMIKPIEGWQDKLPSKLISTGNKGLD